MTADPGFDARRGTDLFLSLRHRNQRGRNHTPSQPSRTVGSFTPILNPSNPDVKDRAPVTFIPLEGGLHGAVINEDLLLLGISELILVINQLNAQNLIL